MGHKAIVKPGISELILESTCIPILALDREYRVIYWNRSLASLTGISPDQAEGLSFPETFLTPEGRLSWTALVDRSTINAVDIKFNWAVAGNPAATMTCRLHQVDSGDGDIIVGKVSEFGSERSRADLSRDLMNDRAAEMRELARFLHDTLAQDLVKLSFFLHELPETAVPEPAPAGIDAQAAKALVVRCCGEIRTLSSILTPIVLTGLPLYASIEQYLNCFRDETAMAVTADLDPLPPLPADVELLFGAVLQACLSRTLRCDRAAQVAVRLRERGRTASLDVEIQTDHPAGLLAGWSVLRERAEALGGECTLAADSSSARCIVMVPCLTPHE